MKDAVNSKVIDFASMRLACSDCSSHELCLPVAISPRDIERLNAIVKRHRPPLQRGCHVFYMGDGFRALYAIGSGSVKTYTITEDGYEQITGFHLAGEIIGLDAICSGQHPGGAIALEPTTLCEIPFQRLEQLAGEVTGLGRQLLRIMSRELHSDSEILTLLGKKSAEERLAALLLSLSSRFQKRGFSAHEFHLSMSRHDIGNYLGLAVETVSRLFTRFQQQGLISVRSKYVRLHDVEQLQELVGASGVQHQISKMRL